MTRRQPFPHAHCGGISTSVAFFQVLSPSPLNPLHSEPEGAERERERRNGGLRLPAVSQDAARLAVRPHCHRVLSLAKLGFASLRWTYVSFLRPGKDLKRRYGSWAVVTGSTDGIGKAFAFQFARVGLNLVLVGRNPEKLRETAAALREGGEIGRWVLVNSAGASYPYARYFHEVDESCRGPDQGECGGGDEGHPGNPSRMIKRKRGAIVNIGSGAAIVIPSDPLYAVYAATKAYVDQLSKCLYVEYQKSGIDVQCQVRPLVRGDEDGFNSEVLLLVPSADTYARVALRWIGHDVRCTPYWPPHLAAA
ncbi:unnamed protein product [Spirodela intermedia]|uniref:Uncharacterized protein n=1 Tax=Spirodela intermedia TaxID=51605 RepID=A0A7I8IRN5_SPIIN|nr:unnamed protein product [Spirodela intermedia]CAA6659631.1 unnamed protein product [Spirodela intermedia]